MRFLVPITLLAGLLVPSSLAGAQLAATGISIPIFDAKGKLTHKLIAQRGSLQGGQQQLEEIEIVYFSAKDPNVIVQRLEASEATWDEKKETLKGTGRVLVATEENRLTGEGFDFALGTSLLHIHRDFKMDNSEFVVTSERATVELIVEREGEEVRVRDVKRCEAVGNLQIKVQPTAKKKYQFEHAASEIAIYDSAKQTIELPQPIRFLDKGRTSTSKTLTINLKK